MYIHSLETYYYLLHPKLCTSYRAPEYILDYGSGSIPMEVHAQLFPHQVAFSYSQHKTS